MKWPFVEFRAKEQGTGNREQGLFIIIVIVVILVVIVIVVFFVVFAGAPDSTGFAIVVLIAIRSFGRELVSLVGVGEGMHGIAGGPSSDERGKVGGDLKPVEELAGAARIDARGGERVENMGERDLDGVAIFQSRNKWRLFRRGLATRGEVVKAIVEKTIGPVFEGDRLTLSSVRHNVATFVVHTRTFLHPFRSATSRAGARPVGGKSREQTIRDPWSKFTVLSFQTRSLRETGSQWCDQAPLHAF